MENYDIIHVDDDPFIRRMVEYSSRNKGLTYKSAETLHGLKEAMETARASFYVVDCNFPRGGDGCSGRSEMLASEAVDHIRENCSNPVIIYTGHESLEKLGMQNYDVKHVMKGGAMDILFGAMEEPSGSN